METIAPSYYAQQDNAWYVGDFILEMGLDFFLGNAVKYLSRYKNKNGVQDLVKMLSYLDRVQTLRQDYNILTIPSAVGWLGERDKAAIEDLCVVFQFSPMARLLLNLICQYSKTGHVTVLSEAVLLAKKLISVTKEEVFHVSV